jgi:hypothetical protein
MSGVDPFENRMRSMLAGVSPAARALLARGADRTMAGTPDAPVARPLASATGDPPPSRTAIPAQLQPAREPESLRDAFFQPIFPFICRGRMPGREPGRIPWPDCERIWTWIARDLAPAEVDSAERSGAVAALDGGLRDLLLGRAYEAAAGVETSATGRRRLAMQIGSDDGFTILADILAGFSHASWISAALANLSPGVTREQIDRRPSILSPLSAALREHKTEGAWLYSATLTRLENPGALARIAVLLANTDRDEELAINPHGPAIDILLSEIEIEVERLHVLRAARAPVPALERSVNRYRQFVRDLASEVDLRQNTRWSRRLSAAKVSASAQLEQEVARADGLTRQVLRTRLVTGDIPVLDADVLDDAERALRVLNVATTAGDVLSLNALVASARRDIDRAFEALIDPLINALRTAQGEEKDKHLARCDGAIRLAGIHYGPEFEAILQRSRNVALSGRAKVPLGA